jgi:AraC family transcriptional regulator
LDSTSAPPRIALLLRTSFGVIVPEGRYVAIRHVGPNATIHDTVARLHGWLRENGALRRDPLILQRVVLFPDVPEHEAITDVMLALA